MTGRRPNEDDGDMAFSSIWINGVVCIYVFGVHWRMLVGQAGIGIWIACSQLIGLASAGVTYHRHHAGRRYMFDM